MKVNHPDNSGNAPAGQSLQAVGLWLKEVREQRGETLDDVSKITRIGRSYLEAIEEGAAAKLPSQAYARGFIRLYATHLGLSPDEAVRLMQEQTAAALQQDLPETISAVPRLQPKASPSTSGNYRKFLFPVIGMVALAAIIITLVGRNSQQSSSPESRTLPAPQPPAAPAPGTTGTAPPSGTTDATPAATIVPQGSGETPAEEGIILRLKAVSNGRLHVTIDGSISQEYDLVAGDLVEWKAEKMFLLDLDDAGSVEAELDGKPLAPLGETGKAAHLIIRQNGVQSN
jgi:cytoskeletal protein RodZ